MLDNKATQLKITHIVNEYTRLMPEEYALFRKAHKLKIENLINPEAKVGKGDGALERLLWEIPESLFNMFRQALDVSELAWWGTKEGSYWFGRTFPQFRVTNKI